MLINVLLLNWLYTICKMFTNWVDTADININEPEWRQTKSIRGSLKFLLICYCFMFSRDTKYWLYQSQSYETTLVWPKHEVTVPTWTLVHVRVIDELTNSQKECNILISKSSLQHYTEAGVGNFWTFP